MKKFLLFMLGVLIALPGIADDFLYEYEGHALFYTVIDEEAKTCKTKAGYVDYSNPYNSVLRPGNSVSGDLVIPSEAGGYTVTAIGEDAFCNSQYMTSVIIPNSVTSIGDGAFVGCESLTSVIIPNSVTSIGDGAFNLCSDLKKVAYPDNLSNRFANSSFVAISYPRETAIIEDGFVYNSDKSTIYFAPASLEGEYIIPNSVTSIGNKAFYGCSSLISVFIPKNVSIGKDAFDSCSGLKKSAYPDNLRDPFPRGVTIGYPIDGVIEDGCVYSSDKSTIYFAPVSLEGEFTIPESVTSIGDDAFSHCFNLTSVIIPNSVASIPSDAFWSSALRWVVIPTSVTSIDEAAFAYCGDLESVVIPTSVTSIGKYAFSHCGHLESVVIPTSVTSIGDDAFVGCDRLVKSAYPKNLSNPFPAGIAIEYPTDGVIEDGFVYSQDKSDIYFAPVSLEGEYTIPNSVDYIRSNAFSRCTRLTSVILPNSHPLISEDAFKDCSGMKKVACPSSTFLFSNMFAESVTIIRYPWEGAIIEDGFVYGPDKCAIYFAPLSLEGEYTIPNSVSSIGENAFKLCGLTGVKALSEVHPTMDDTSFDGLYDTAALSVPEGAATDYLATNWSLFKNLRVGDTDMECNNTYTTGNLKYRLIPAQTEGDNNLAVVVPGDYSSLTEVTIPERISVSENGSNVRYYVDAIGYKAFNGCSNLATVTFNSRNTSKAIGDYAFAGTQISALTIPETVESIGDHAFDGCTSLTNIEIPGNVRSIGNYAFRSCSAFTEITIPGSVKTIGEQAFYDISKLKKLTLNEGLETIGKGAFSGDYRVLEPIYIPSTLKTVGSSAFSLVRCDHVNISDLAAWCNIDFENENSNPAQCLFFNNQKIENLIIPETVTRIGLNAFCGNTALQSVTFPDGLRIISEGAFNNCSSLSSAVVIPGSVMSIGKNAFESTGVRDLTFSYGAEDITVSANAFPRLKSLSWDRPFGDNGFNRDDLISLTIGNSVTEIPAATFKNAYKLTSLTLGNSLTAIGDEAFSNCTALTDVVLPPSVETIGASAFAGNTKLTSIIMGHNVKTIGEKAYDLCPAQTVFITAQTPPTAPDNTFSNYTGNLYVQGQDAVSLYYDADFCWYQFEGHVMIEPTDMKVEGDKTLNGKPGDTFQLSATLMPDNVTLPQIFWRSTNPDIATVDENGLVTLHADLSEVMAMAEGDDDTSNSCKIIAESLYANGLVAEFTVNNAQSGIDEIIEGATSSDGIDYNAPIEVFNLQGVRVADTIDNIATGIYIIRQGKNVQKVLVK